MTRKPHPNSKPKRFTGGSWLPSASDSWEMRLRIALRLDNGAVFTARQCREVADALGWNRRTGDAPAEAS